ncbi:MAG: ROK family protein, partial [Clostridia bacterium]|nr:ROK family protein [Clostridia bacterium]
MYKLGIDLGGTNIVAGVVDKDYNILAKASRKTRLPRPAEEIVDDIAAVLQEAILNAGIDKSQIDSVGLGTPGAIDPKAGVISYANNLNFYDLPICNMLKERTGFDI